VFETFEAPSGTGELIAATLRRLDVDAQIVEVRVDATMIRFDVSALLVASNANALRRFHYFFSVTFTDNGGPIMSGDVPWPDEVVVFSEDGYTATLPFPTDEDFVAFVEVALGVAWAANYAEFVTFADYAVNILVDVPFADAVSLSTLSVAINGVVDRSENVFLNESLTVLGGNGVVIGESVSISEVMIGGVVVVFGDAVFMAETWTNVLDYAVFPDSVTLTDTMAVSEVGGFDSRPGAFIPGAALLGSPT